MPRPEKVPDRIVRLWVLILVPDEETDRRSERLAFKDPAQDLDLIRLAPGCRDRALARPPAVELLLNALLRYREIRFDAVDQDTDPLAMALSERRDPKQTPQ